MHFPAAVSVEMIAPGAAIRCRCRRAVTNFEDLFASQWLIHCFQQDVAVSQFRSNDALAKGRHRRKNNETDHNDINVEGTEPQTITIVASPM